MIADYEPWWQFDGWEETIVSTEEFETEQTFLQALDAKLKTFREVYSNEKSKDDRFYAFWSDEESEYCEACEDDIQMFHGIIVEKNIKHE